MRVSGWGAAVAAATIWLGACGDDDSRDADAGRDAATADAGDLDGGVDAGTDAGATTDAGTSGPDLDCYDTALPAAPDPMSITAHFHQGGVDIADGTVQVRWRSDDSLLAEGTSDEEGTFSFSVDTGGVAADVYFVFEATGHPKHFLYTGWPLYEDETINFQIYADEIIDAVSDMTGVEQDAAAGQIHVTARDCSLRPLQDAEFELSSAPELMVYVVGDTCSVVAEDLSQSGACGAAAALNVPPGTVEVSGALVDGPVLHTQSVVVEAGAFTRLTMRPRRL